MTIGSVPPNDNYACIRNVTFRNIVQHFPLKAIYVKTNPGTHGSGCIENILYENFTINDPVWWAIYIGPQQQKQPGGGGPGCMIYPLDKDCQTQPRIDVRNITLRSDQLPNTLKLSSFIEKSDAANLDVQRAYVKGDLFLFYLSTLVFLLTHVGKMSEERRLVLGI